MALRNSVKNTSHDYPCRKVLALRNSVEDTAHEYHCRTVLQLRNSRENRAHENPWRTVLALRISVGPNKSVYGVSGFVCSVDKCLVLYLWAAAAALDKIRGWLTL